MINFALNREPRDGTSKVVNVRCPLSGKTLLHEAIAAEDIGLIEKLLRLGANVHIASYQGETPLQTASRCVNKSIERLIEDTTIGLQLQHDIACGSFRNLPQTHINFRNPINGNTALHLCIFDMIHLSNQEREKRVALLFDLGADPYVTNYALVRPIDILYENWHNLPFVPPLEGLSIFTPKIADLIRKASETQRFNRGVLHFHKSGYITTYDLESESMAFCRRALSHV